MQAMLGTESGGNCSATAASLHMSSELLCVRETVSACSLWIAVTVEESGCSVNHICKMVLPIVALAHIPRYRTVKAERGHEVVRDGYVHVTNITGGNVWFGDPQCQQQLATEPVMVLSLESLSNCVSQGRQMQETSDQSVPARLCHAPGWLFYGLQAQQPALSNSISNYNLCYVIMDRIALLMPKCYKSRRGWWQMMSP